MICCSIVSQNKDDAIQDILGAAPKCDMIEIRLDHLDDINKEMIREMIRKKPCPIIFTCRSEKEGGNFKGSEEERISILKQCIECGADYIDIELSTGKKIVSDIISRKKETKVIVSYHNFEKVPDNLSEIIDEIHNLAGIAKVACMAEKLRDNLSMLRLIEEKSKEKEIIGLCMGEKGEISRILNIAYGSLLTYGYLNRKAASGQIKVEFLKRLFRSDKLKKERLKVYGLVGNPVSKSRGYIVHNLMFKDNEMNSVYVNFPVEEIEEFIRQFRGFFSGISVTMPFKQSIMDHLDEVDQDAEKIGAVNTVIETEGKLKGYNTDIDGGIHAIEEKISIENKNIVLLGAGGAARALGLGIVKKKGNLFVVNRTEKKGESLAKDLGAQFKKIDAVDWNNVDILINATSVGMMPNRNESPVKGSHLKDMVVFDAVYNPLMTKLLDMAERNGCTIISGIKMFLYQAARQFELFTGKKPDIEFMEEKVLEYVSE